IEKPRPCTRCAGASSAEPSSRPIQKAPAWISITPSARERAGAARSPAARRHAAARRPKIPTGIMVSGGGMRCRWNEAEANQLHGLDLLVYASRLVGAETSLVIWG